MSTQNKPKSRTGVGFFIDRGVIVATACVDNAGMITPELISANARQVLNEANTSGHSLIIDFSNVEKITYHKLELLVQFASELQAQGIKASLCSVQSQIHGMVMLLTRNNLYTLHPDRGSALSYCEQYRTIGKTPLSEFDRLQYVKINTIVGHVNYQNESKQLVEREHNLESPAAPDNRTGYVAALLKATAADANYEQVASALSEAHRDFCREMAARLEPALNAHVRAMPHDTYEEKKALAKWVNDELRRFDLAIKCPKTGQPSLILVGSGNHPKIGRFILEHKTPEGKRVRSVHTPDLPQLELMEANPRREALVEWRDRVGDQRGGAARE